MVFTPRPAFCLLFMWARGGVASSCVGRMVCVSAACWRVLVAGRVVAIFVGEGPFGVGAFLLFLFAHPRESACLYFCVVWSVRFYCGWFSCWREG